MSTILIEAVSGDLSATGMNDQATRLTVTENQWLQIDEYQTLNKAIMYLFEANLPTRDLSIRAAAIAEALHEVFPSKWHYRTTWKVVQ